jgi:hypothetical protein
MPGRRDCLFTGRGPIHHRGEHHDLRPPRGLLPCGHCADGTAEGGRRRRVSSMPALSTTSAASKASDTVPTQ